MPALLYLANAWVPGAFRLLLYGLVVVVGTLVGLEIPLVMRILRRHVQLKDLVSQVLTFDYLGRAGGVGGLSAGAGAAAGHDPHRPPVRLDERGSGAVGALAASARAAPAGCARAGLCRHPAAAERRLRAGRPHHHAWPKTASTRTAIVFSASSPYQRIVVTRGGAGHRLFLNGNLQFAERDEYRYHEALVHPAMAAHGAPKKVAVLGGGDGMAVREILKYPSVEQRHAGRARSRT